MGKYIKKFDTHLDYEDFIETEDFILPNVSYCVDNVDVHYNPFIPPETRLILILNIDNAGNPTYLGNTSKFTQIEIDGVVQPSVVESYTFSTNGEHIVKYTLINSTSILEYSFGGCGAIDSIIIPNSVTTIENYAFVECMGLSSVIIPDSVTAIGDYNFSYSYHLTSVTIEATTPPTLGNNVFTGSSSGFKIYVPAASVETYKAASGWSTYAADIEPIPTT